MSQILCFGKTLKAHLQPTGISAEQFSYNYENPAKAEIYPITSLQ